jgi:lipopolysaccharide heptosyltransferase II
MSSNWEGVRKILCVRLDNLGDVLMSTPAMRALAQRFPQARLSLLASGSGAALAPFLPDIHELIVYDAPWVKQVDAGEVVTDLDMLQRLRAGAFDAAVIFTVYSQSALPAALFCRMAGIPRVLAHARENPYALIDEWARDSLPADGGRHEVQRQLDLVAKLGARATDPRLIFALREQDRQGMRDKLIAHGVDPAGELIVVHPGATAASRRYPAEYFALAVRRLARHAKQRLLLTGTAAEHLLAQTIGQASLAAPVNLAGALSLGEFAALIEAATVLVSNNSSPVHIAAAMGTPVVDLYALTNPQHTPWRVPHRLLYHDVPCRYCYHSICPQGHQACLRGVEPDAVVAAALDLLRLSADPSKSDTCAQFLPAIQTDSAGPPSAADLQATPISNPLFARAKP